jgi:hypothetical protein
MAAYNKDTEREEALRKELASPAMVTRFKILMKAVALYNKG